MSRPLLCATVFASDLRSALARAAAAPPEADLIEFRLDALRDPDPERLVRESPRPVILTCRPRRQGGAFAGDETERLQLLARGIAAGAAYVDVELDAAAALGDRGGARLIVSWHDLAGTPADLAGLLARIRSHSPDVAKIVTTATGPEDVLRLLDLLSRPGPPLAAHPMGRAGLAGRVLAARAGSAIVYGAADSRGPGAPGQPALRTLIDDYRLDRDLAGIPSLLLLGGRLGHSVSPRMMNRTFAARELPALYVPFEVDDPEPVLRGLARLAAVGAAVTIPLKERVAGLVDDLDPVAARLGAVNTVVREGARLAGGNTDVGGAMDAIRAVRPDLAGCRAVVLGAGGAARAIGGGLVWAGARVVFVNRTRERARRLAEMLGATESALDAVDPASVDLLVNATPVGQWPRAGECPVPESFPRAGQVVMDAVFNPVRTRLLRIAGSRGATVIPGIEMLARQGARQIEVWLGRTGLLEDLRREGLRALAERERSVLLVGMRGAGKTTIGRGLAARLDREFLDLDEEVERGARATIPEIFAREGEEGFRRRELAALEAVLDRRDLVVAAGGGTVTIPAAREAAARFLVVWLEAPLEVLADRICGSQRPPLTVLPFRKEMETLLLERSPLYRELAHVTVSTATGGPAEVTESILEALEMEG